LFIETHALTKQYRDVLALSECSIGVERGEVFGLLGPNGAGKTTLLRLLLGFLQPTSGTARIDTLDCYNQSVQVHQRTSYLPGEARLFRNMRGREVLRFFSRLRPDVSYERSKAIADRLGLDTSRLVAFMSTGMRQKLAISVALAPDVPLIILDEPTSSLDPSMRAEVLALVREIRDEGRTVLFSSHVLSEVEDVCDRVAILRGGKLVYTQVMSELRHQHRIRARLVGSLAPVPSALSGAMHIEQQADDRVMIETPGQLAPLLGWLATLPLEEVQIQPVGLQTIYDRFHQGNGR